MFRQRTNAARRVATQARLAGLHSAFQESLENAVNAKMTGVLALRKKSVILGEIAAVAIPISVWCFWIHSRWGGWIALGFVIALSGLSIFLSVVAYSYFMEGEPLEIAKEIVDEFDEPLPLPNVREFFTSSDLCELRRKSVRDLKRRRTELMEERERNNRFQRQQQLAASRAHKAAEALAARAMTRQNALQQFDSGIAALKEHLLDAEMRRVEQVRDSATPAQLASLLDELEHAVRRRRQVQPKRSKIPRVTFLSRETKPREIPVPNPKAAKILPEARIINLMEVENSLQIEHLLPKDVDVPMAKKIIIELMDLGNRKSAFGECYRAEDTLKRMVARRSAREKVQFDPKSFSRTLRWLRKMGILVSKPKTDEEVFSLSPRPGLAADAPSAELIRTVIRFYNGISTT